MKSPNKATAIKRCYHAHVTPVPDIPFRNKAERELAQKYSPFRDHPAPNYLKYGRRVEPPKKDECMIVNTTVRGRPATIEWRGCAPRYLYGGGVVGGYDPKHFA